MPFLRPLEYHLKRFHDKQETAWLAYKAGRDIVLDWARRSGKTELIAEVLVEDTEDHGKDSMYIALTQGQAREIIWQKLVSRIGDRVKDWKSNESRLEWKHIQSNAVISLKGADLGKDKLRGSAKRLICLDEFAFYRDPSIVKDVLVPQIADYNGQFIYTSTPRGKNHFYDLKQRALREPDKFFTSHCTVFQNPFISPEGRDKLLAEYSGPDDPLYRQEILAEYVVFNGLAFALPQDSYVERRWDPADLDHSYHWRGVDHGYSPDPTACLWMAYNRRKGHFLIYNEYKQSRLLIKQHADVIGGLEPYYYVASYSDIDPQLIAEYEDVGLHLTPAQKADKQARILRLVNALRTGKLKIAPECVGLLKEMASYEWDQDGNDHLCFVAGTMIETDRGLVAIELLDLKDRVMTRHGFQPILQHGESGVFAVIDLTFDDGTHLTCTPNHPIYTENRGFQRADGLNGDDVFVKSTQWVTESKQNLSQSSLTGLRSEDTQTQSKAPFGITIGHPEITSNLGLAFCTEKCGSFIMARSRPDTTCIIAMPTLLITTSRTLSAFLPQNTSQNTGPSEVLEHRLKNRLNCSLRFALLRKSGTPLKKALSGTGNTLLRLLKIVPLFLQSAVSVLQNIRFETLTLQELGFAQRSASLPRGASRGLMTSLESAYSAVKNSKAISIQHESSAANPAPRLIGKAPAAPQKVFNLTVANHAEYFANGILVHNCDALNYIYNNAQVPEEPAPDAPVDPFAARRSNNNDVRQNFG